VHGESFLKKMPNDGGIKRRQPDDMQEDTPRVKKPRMSDYLSCSRGSSISQKKVDDLILNFVVSDMQPISVIEGTGLRSLLEYLNPKVKTMCTETLKTRLIKKFEDVLIK